MNKSKIILAGLFFLTVHAIFAQDSTSSKGNLTISGSVDAYYRYNFQNAKDSGRTFPDIFS